MPSARALKMVPGSDSLRTTSVVCAEPWTPQP